MAIWKTKQKKLDQSMCFAFSTKSRLYMIFPFNWLNSVWFSSTTITILYSQFGEKITDKKSLKWYSILRKSQSSNSKYTFVCLCVWVDVKFIDVKFTHASKTLPHRQFVRQKSKLVKSNYDVCVCKSEKKGAKLPKFKCYSFHLTLPFKPFWT